MKSDLPFIVNSKLSRFYYDNKQYDLINNVSYVYVMNHIIKYIVYINEGRGTYSAKLYYDYYMYLSYLERLNEI